MIYYVSSDIWALNNEKDIRFLDKILINGLVRNRMLIDEESVFESPWYLGLRATDKKFVDEFFNDTATETREPVFKISNQDKYGLNLEQAEYYLNDKVKIILENGQFDAYFIDAIIRLFPKKSRELKLHVEKSWVEFTNAGGRANVPNVLATEKSRLSRLNKFDEPYHPYAVLFC
jgi:hypothetical protein